MRVELSQITKIFGKLRANDAISMTFEGGMIYAVLGENGAGKSTLMKILSGYQPPDAGRITINGADVAFSSPADALARGIGMLHQDPLDVMSLTVLENFILGGEPGMLPNRRAARERFVKVAADLGFALNPDSYIDSLTIGERQQCEIVRLLSLGAQVLILDEPTTGISAEQKDALFSSLRRLASERGLIVILVSHKLEDVQALCDHVYVLRRGEVVGNRAMPIPAQDLVTMMFGQNIEFTARVAHNPGASALSVRDLSVQGSRLTVRNVNIDVRAGEVIGIAGLDGSGQLAFLQACAGLVSPNSGTIRLYDEDITRVPYHARTHMGIAFAPAGRLEEGLVGGLTLAEHFALGLPGNAAWINWRDVNTLGADRIRYYNIKGDLTSPIQTLSGGNQQRMLLALLPENLRLLLLENPTRGLDVGSARWMWGELLKRTQKGTSILFISPDLDEIMAYSDRIMVFYGGQATLVDDPARMTTDTLGHLIGGSR
jgi:general nucleoside transport system ATP-binding protein